MIRTRQIFSLLLTLAMLMAVMAVPAMASDETGAEFQLTCEFDKASYNVGDTVTVKFYLTRTDSTEGFHLFSFSDTVMFNKLYLRYQDSSADKENIFRVTNESVYMNRRYDGVSINYVYIGSGYSPVRENRLMAGVLRFTALANIHGGQLLHTQTSANVVSGADNVLDAVAGTYTIGSLNAEYGVSFSSGGGSGSGPQDMSDMAAGDVFYMPDNTYVRDGYIFTGWSDGSSSLYKPMDVYEMPESNVSFTAQWSKNPVLRTASFDGSGATDGEAPSSISCYEGSKLSIPTKATLVRSGYTFEGWSYDGLTYQPGDSVTMPENNITFTAVWKSIDTGALTGGGTSGGASGGTSGGATQMSAFSDVSSGTYYYDAVIWAVNKNVTNGVTATTFGPALSCTRGQVVTFLWRAMGSPEPEGVGSFSDVASGTYYEKAVKWAVQHNITNGTSTSAFSPEATVTRAQFVTFLWRAAGCPSASGNVSFSDVTDSTAYYYNAVLWAAENGITQGVETGKFAPGDVCMRGQVVTFLYRYLGK